MKSIVNNITVQNQNLFLSNKEKLENKAYGKYLNQDLYLSNEIIKHVQKGELPSSEVTSPTPDSLNEMLKGQKWQSTGYSVLEDGTAYTASLTDFPGASGEMFEWWFWWHSVESERYALWHPYCHVSAEAANKEVLTDASIRHRDKYIGNAHIITEYLNDLKNDIRIEFIDPVELGFEQKDLDDANIVGSACGFVYAQKPKIKTCTMIHLFKKTDSGGQLISRYYIGDQLSLSIGEKEFPLPDIAKNVLLKGRTARLQVAYEQLMHDQIEFTNLASFLPSLYKEYVGQT